MALLTVLTAAIIVTAAFADTTPPVPARFTAFLVLMPTVAVAIAMRNWRQRAGDSAERLRRARGRTRGGDPPRGRGGAGPHRERAARRGDAQRERDGGAGGRRPPGARQLARPDPRGPDRRRGTARGRGQRPDRDGRTAPPARPAGPVRRGARRGRRRAGPAARCGAGSVPGRAGPGRRAAGRADHHRARAPCRPGWTWPPTAWSRRR